MDPRFQRGVPRFPVPGRTRTDTDEDQTPFPVEEAVADMRAVLQETMPEVPPPAVPMVEEKELRIRPSGIATDLEPGSLLAAARCVMAKNVRFGPDGLTMMAPAGGRKVLMNVLGELRGESYKTDLLAIAGEALLKPGAQLVTAWDSGKKPQGLLPHPKLQHIGEISPLPREKPPRLNILDPNGGETIDGLVTYRIEWETLSSDGSPHPEYGYLKLELYKAGDLIKTIVASTANSTEYYDWVLTADLFEIQGSGVDLLGIPSDEGSADDFRMVIRAVISDFYWDEGDAEFRINAPRVRMTAPDSDTVIDKTGSPDYVVTWDLTQATHAAMMTLKLYKGAGVFQANISDAAGTALNVTGAWTAAPSAAAGQTTFTHTAAGFDTMNLVGRGLQPNIDNTETYEILSATANTLVVSDPSGVAAGNTSSGDTYVVANEMHWTVSDALADGTDYYIRAMEVTTPSSKIWDDSDNFEIGSAASTVTPVLKVGSPDKKGQVFERGTSINIAFKSEGYAGKLELLLVGGLVYDGDDLITTGAADVASANLNPIWSGTITAGQSKAVIWQIPATAPTGQGYGFKVVNKEAFTSGSDDYDVEELVGFSPHAFEIKAVANGGGGTDDTPSITWTYVPTILRNAGTARLAWSEHNMSGGTKSYSLSFEWHYKWDPGGSWVGFDDSTPSVQPTGASWESTLYYPTSSWGNLNTVIAEVRPVLTIVYTRPTGGTVNVEVPDPGWIRFVQRGYAPAFFHIWERESTYGATQIYRVDLADGSNAEPEMIIDSTDTDQVPAYATYGTDYVTARKLLTGRDGRPLVLWMDAMERESSPGVPRAKKEQPGYRVGDSARLIKYDETGRLIWNFDAAGAVRTTEVAADTIAILEHAAIAVSDETGNILVALAGYTITSGTYARRLWCYLVDAADGSKLQEQSFPTLGAGVSLDATHDWGICGVYGATWSETGDFWITADYKYQDNGGTAYDPTEFQSKLWRIKEDWSETATVDLEAEGAEYTVAVGLDYHPSGYLLLPCFYLYDPSGYNVRRTGLMILTPQGVEVRTIGFEYDDSGSGVHETYPHPLGACGLERNGPRFANFTINRQTNVKADFLRPGRVRLSDGRYLFEFDVDDKLGRPRAVDVGGTMAQGTVHTYGAHGLNQLGNGDWMAVAYEHHDDSGDANDDLRVRIRVLRAGPADTRTEITKGFVSGDAVNDPFLPQPYIAYGGPDGSGDPTELAKLEFPWCEIAVTGASGGEG